MKDVPWDAMGWNAEGSGIRMGIQYFAFCARMVGEPESEEQHRGFLASGEVMSIYEERPLRYLFKIEDGTEWIVTEDNIFSDYFLTQQAALLRGHPNQYRRKP